MNPTLLTTSPSTSSQRPVLHPSLFLNPTPLRLGTTARRCIRVSCQPRCSASASSDQPATISTSPSPEPDIFGGQKELTGIQPLVKSFSPPVRLAASAILVASAAAAGYTLGYRFGRSQTAALGGAAVLGAAGGAAAYAVRASVPEVAAVDLHNFVASFDDPGAVKREDIDQIAGKLVRKHPSFVVPITGASLL